MSRSCVRPGCDRVAAATMSYDYRQRSVWIQALARDRDPHVYELCEVCAQKMTPPQGWVLTDLRARSLFEAAS
jgi:hypothetical protein